MKKKIRLTESELIRLIGRIIKEEKYSEEDIKYTHPTTGVACKIKVAENKVTNNENSKFGAILVCDNYNDGEYMVTAELPVNGPTPESVSDFICENIEKTYEILNDMLDHEEFDEELMEAITHRRWNIIDQPIVCSDKPKKKKSWEY
tara:strand:- start:220 stop:660 length:441 start_codon:yes stop_codon:yes gene_type:complete